MKQEIILECFVAAVIVVFCLLLIVYVENGWIDGAF